MGLLGLTAAGTVAFRQQAETAATISATVTVPGQTAATGLTRSYSEQANGVTGYLLTDNPLFLGTYLAGKSDVARLQRVIGQRFGHDPTVMSRLNAVREAERTWRQRLVEPQIDAGRGPGPAPLSPGDSVAAHQLFEDLRRKVADLHRRIDEIAASERAKAAEARTVADWFTAIIFLAGFVVAAVSIVFLRKSLTRPLRTLVSQIDQVASGDLNRSVEGVGPPELTMVGRAVETMRGRILSESSRAAQMHQDLARYEEAERRRAEQDYATVVAALDEGVILIDSGGDIESANPAAQRILGVSESELVGSSPASWRAFDESGEPLRSRDIPPESTRLTGLPENSRVFCLERPDGSRVWLSATSRALTPQDRPSQLVVTSFTDITESRTIRERLEYEATHDPLTGLVNRTLVLQYCAARSPANPMAVLFIDLDNFKRINDSLGHGAGDDVLRILGERLVRAAPEALIGRLGGDEFVVISQNEDHYTLIKLADRLLSVLTEPVHVQGKQLHVNASVGIVVSPPDDTRTGQDLLRDADVAMYQAKTRVGVRHAFFDVELRERVQRHMALEQDLRQAVQQDQLWVAYQSFVNLRTDRTVAVEGLLRWAHPVHGAISPAEFIPLAEESELINPIGAHMLRTATLQLAAEREFHELDLRLNANLSPRQLEDPDLPTLVQQALAASGLPAHSLCLEITENAIMQDPATAARVLNTLRELGVCLAIDDFGTGYSSLAQLRRLPLDILKIDRSFVGDLGDSYELEVLVTSIVAMAHGVGLEVVAEGVETAEQLAILRRIGCDQAQGFYFGKPAPIDGLFNPPPL